MAQGDFSLKVTADFSEVLAGFSKLKQPADQAGAAVGKGLGDGITAAGKTVDALMLQLLKLQQQKAKLPVDSSEFKAAEQQIEAVKTEMAALRNQKVQLQVDATDAKSRVAEINSRIGALIREIGNLKSLKATLDVDSSEYKQAEADLASLRQERSDLNKEKLKLQADTTEIDKAADALGDLGEEADSNKNRFGLLEGAVAGVAASLSSALVTGAQQAITAVGSLITNFGALDTEIRKAAAAGGESGGYDKIARTVDQVGIEAAGTSLEVAQLATELVRGGMTIDQANDSLGAIVRGAEATGTQFSTMGSVVSATLKGFGLEASKATTVVDALVQGANASATDVTGMGNAMKYAAPVARILGVDVKGLGTAIGLLSNAGIDASEAGVTLRNGLSKLAMAAPRTGGKVQELTGQAKIAADTMKQLNIDIYNTDGTLKPMETTLLELKRAFEKLDPASKIRLASNLFGGEDDGTKWLAMLSQSETDIRKMSDAMNNSEGATDKARTAMQGFQMKMAQLQGTLDSIGTGIGKVAAMALTPLVDIVNQAIGAFAALPTPIKDFLSAVALVAGGVATATAALVVFKTAVQTAVVQSAITGVGQLAVGIGTTLVGAVKGVVAVIPGLLTQLALLGQVNVATAMGTIATTLRSTFLTAVGAAATAVSKFVVYLTSVSFASLVSGIGSVVTAIAPLALAIGAVTLAVTTWQTILSGSQQVQSDFADAQNKAKTAADNLKIALNNQATAATSAKNAWQSFLDYAKESLALGELQTQFGSLQAKFTAVQMEANKFYTTIRDNETLTTEETQRANALATALQSQNDVMTQLISSFKQKAKQAAADGNTDLEQNYLRRASALGVELQANNNLIAAYNIKLGKQSAIKTGTEQQTIATNEQTKAEQSLNDVIAEAPVRALADQITTGQQLATLIGSISQLEQSRYSVTRAQLDYEMTKAKERGASENTINNIKRKIDTLDANALSARYKALQMEQTLQQALLLLSQQKAMSEANLEVLSARKTALQAEAKISKAANDQERTAAIAERDLANAMIGIAIQKRDLLIKTQPIERAIAAANDETADNAERAKAASMGYQLNTDGTLIKVKGLTTELSKVETLTAGSAREVGTYQRLAAAAGLTVSQAKDGTIVLGQRWQDVTAEVSTLNTNIDGASSKTGAVKSGADGIKTALQQALGPAAGVVNAFVSAGEEAPGAVTAAKGFSSSLSVAAQASSAIRDIRLDTYMGNISSSTSSAATAAQNFYGWLQKAASLPVARWTGGPVEGGESYRVNELGQEALLSGGRLSLINAPSGGTWRAPSSGIVVPAGITAELQARGALPVRASRLTGGGSAIAEQVAVGAQQAVVLGKLEQAVDRLAAREWNVNVTMRQGPTGSQVIKHLNRLL